MKEKIRQIIRESINNIVEVQEGSKNIISNIQQAILKSEIAYKDMMGFHDFSFSDEIKEQIRFRILKVLREIQNIAHVADIKNKIQSQSGYGNPQKDKNVFLFEMNDMYFYKLGSFEALENDEFKKVIFKPESVLNIIPSSASFILDSIYVIVFKDTFYDFGFYNSHDTEENLIKYMKSTFKQNVDKRETEPKKFIVSIKYNNNYKLSVGKPLETPEETQKKKDIKLNSLKVKSLLSIPSYGWGQIISIKDPFIYVSFPKERKSQIFTSSRPILKKNNGGEEILTKDKFPMYLEKVGGEIKKFDANTLFMQAMKSKMSGGGDQL